MIVSNCTNRFVASLGNHFPYRMHTFIYIFRNSNKFSTQIFLLIAAPSRYWVFTFNMLFDEGDNFPTVWRCICMLCFVYMSLFQAQSQIHCGLRCYERGINCAGYVYNATANPMRWSNCLIVIVWDISWSVHHYNWPHVRRHQIIMPAAIHTFVRPFTQIAKIIGSTSIRHRSDTFASSHLHISKHTLINMV